MSDSHEEVPESRNLSSEFSPAESEAAVAAASTAVASEKAEHARRGGGSPLLWGLGLLLLVASLVLLFWVIPGGTTDLAKRGIRTEATVQLADSKPGPNGESEMTVTFIFQDSMRRNRQVTRRMFDQGRWSELKPGKEIKVIYLPENPDGASLEGGEGLASKQSATLTYVAWSALIVGAFLTLRAWLSPRKAARPQPSVKITMARR